MSKDYSFDCPHCGEENIIEVDVISWGHPGTAPSLSYPGDPPEGVELDFTTPKRCQNDDMDELCIHREGDDGEDFPAAFLEKFDDKVYEYFNEYDHSPDY